MQVEEKQWRLQEQCDETSGAVWSGSTLVCQKPYDLYGTEHWGSTADVECIYDIIKG